MQDSNIAILAGQGLIGNRKLTKLAESWGKLPEKERAKAMRELTRDLPPAHRELIERYFKQIAEARSTSP